MTSNQTLDTIFSRSSYRGDYKPVPVPRGDLTAIMKAGMATPSGCNRQTASFIAVDDEHLLSQIRAIFPKPSCRTAPAMILVFTQEIASVDGHIYNVQDYGAAIQNMLLAIKSLGYETCWYEGNVRPCAKELAALLHVPEVLRLVCLLPVGIPVNGPAKGPEKKPFEERAWFNGFGNNESPLECI